VDALSLIVHKDVAQERGKILIERMHKLIPHQMFEAAPQRKAKRSKKRMNRVGRVDIPQEAFLAVLRVGAEEND
jgi:GTP-binding protein LepA